MMTYATAYLKKYHTLDFFKVLLQLSHYGKNKPRDEISEIFYDAKLFKINIRGPSVRLGNRDFEVYKGSIFFGLKHIRGIGEAAVEKITSLKDCTWGQILANRKGIKRPALKALIYSGAFDHLGLRRLQMDTSIDFADALTPKENILFQSLLLTGEPVELRKNKTVNLGKGKSFRDAIEKLTTFLETENVTLKAIAKNRAEKLLKICYDFLNQREEDEVDIREKAGYEIYYLGIPATCSEVDIYKDSRKTHSCIKIKKELDNMQITTIALIMDVFKKRDRFGNEMAFIKFSDKTYMMEGIMFSTAFQQFGSKIEPGKVMLIKGVKRKGTFLIEKVKNL
jgi:DNA polymerase III alpha subunit